MLFAVAMVLGAQEQRVKKASWFSDFLFYPFSRSLKTIQSNSTLKKQIEGLQRHLSALTTQNLKLRNELKAIDTAMSIDISGELSQLEIAEVTGYSGLFHERNLIINKGLAYSIRKDSPVISANGIVGKVVMVASRYSVVLPISNPMFQTPVMSLNGSVQGIFQNDVQGKFYMNMVKIGSQISVGDTIVCSNLSQVFPKGYPVGSIVRIRESKDNLFISAEIQPFTQVENLEHVFVLKPQERYE